MQKKNSKKKGAPASGAAAQTTSKQLTANDLLKRDDLSPNVRECLKNLERSSYFERTRKAEIDFVCEVIYGEMTADNELPDAAVVVVESYLRDLTESYNLFPWTDSTVARAMYEQAVELQGGGLVSAPTMSFQGLRSAVRALCTAEECNRFLVEGKLSDSTAPSTRDEQDYEAALKAARLIADPRTPKKTRSEIITAICDLSNATDVQVTHPVLVERALTVMFESMSKRVRKQTWTPNRRDAYAQLIGLLATVEEGN